MKNNVKYLMAFIIGICLTFCGLFGLIGCGGSTDEVAGTVEQPQEETSATEKSVYESLFPFIKEEQEHTEKTSQEDDKIYVGDTFTAYSSDGSPVLEATVLDAGTTIDNMLDERIVYVELDIKNLYNEQLTIGGALQGFYGDDYLLDNAFTDDNIYSSMVAPGRKVKGRLCAFCPDYDQYNVIEMEYAYRSIVIKDPSMESSDEVSVPENVDTSEMLYGTYVYHDTEHGNINTAEVGFASGEGANYIYIDSRGEGGHGVIEFVGYFQEANEDNSYTAIQSPEDYFEAEVRCTFVDGGLNVEVVSSEFDELYDAAGYYELESELNLDEVG